MYSLVLERPSKDLSGHGSSKVAALLAFLLLLMVGLLLMPSQAVYADGHAQPYRFAVVNMSAILKRAPQSAAESEQLEERFASRERALADKQDELRRADEVFGRERNLLSSDELVQRESELRAFQRRLKREREDLREEVRISKDRALNRLQSKVAEAIDAIRQREAIDIIFRESDYIVASERMDVTNKVLEELQQQFESAQSRQSTQNNANAGQDDAAQTNTAQDVAQEETAAGE